MRVGSLLDRHAWPAVKKNLVTALLSALKWHAHSRRFGSKQLSVIARNYLLNYLNADSNIDTNGEKKLLLNFSGKISTAVDVGANHGDWTQAVLDLYPDARCDLFDPVPQLILSLEKRFREKNNVRIYACGLSDSSRSMVIYYDENHDDMSTIYPNAPLYKVDKRTEVPIFLTRGDCFFQDNSTVIDIMKIDVEGHELAVLEGFEKTIESRRVRVIQFEHNRFSVLSRTYVRDFFMMLSNLYKIGPLTPKGALFGEYNFDMEDYRYSNFVAVLKGETDLIKSLQTFKH